MYDRAKDTKGNVPTTNGTHVADQRHGQFQTGH